MLMGAPQPPEAPCERSDDSDSKPAKAPPGSGNGICATIDTTGLITRPEPQVVGAGSRSACEPFREIIEGKIQQELSAQRIFQDLIDEQHYKGSYYSVRRFVVKLTGHAALPMRRMECAPGFEAQVDYGTGAPVLQPDGRRRRTHVFRVVLSHSRKGYSEACYRQTTEEFLRCLENAFRSFGGVPRTVVIDNLRAAVTHPDWYDPELTPKLRDFCAHYATTILPTKPYTPRHKGKIERGIGYVKGNALKGRTFSSLEEQNQHLEHWERTVADTRIHGTTRQHVGQVFEEAERPALGPLRIEPFALFHEAQRQVHRDGHVEVAKAYYSVPPEHLGRTVWVRWDARIVRVFNLKMTQIAVHVRHDPGRFSTQTEHIAREKIQGVERGAKWLMSKVNCIGLHATAWAEAMLCARGVEGTRVLMGLVALTRHHSSVALEIACKTALSSREFRLRSIRGLLTHPAEKVQQELAFLDEHPLIRPLDDYARIVADALARKCEVEASASDRGMRFERHDWANECAAQERENPDGNRHQGLRDIHPPRSGYPSSGCSPAEPESVSPDNPE
jgi:transposase